MKHKKQLFEWNGERSREESGWSWICLCGHTESASTKAEAHSEWMYHKETADWNWDAKPFNNDKTIRARAGR